MESFNAKSAAYASQQASFNGNSSILGLYDQAEECTPDREPTLLEELRNRLAGLAHIQQETLMAQAAQWNRIMGPEPVSTTGTQGSELKPGSLAVDLSALVDRVLSQAGNIRSNAERANTRI